MQVSSGEIVAAGAVGLVFLVRLSGALYQARRDGQIAARREASTR